MKNPSIRARKIVGMSIAPAAILIAGALVWQSSYAAFSTSTRSAGNSWSTGSVALTDDDKGAAAFTAEKLVPGATGEKCIVVTSTADVPGVVKTYVANLSTSGDRLADHIVFTLESGAGGSFNDCTGFVPDNEPVATRSITEVASESKDYASGGHAWATSGAAEARSYRAKWTFDTTGLTQHQVDSLQGATVSADFVWEFQTSGNE